MRPHLRYLRYVVRHKWFVFREGLRVGVPIRQLIIHDWSKFLPSEWFPYVRYFYGAPEEEAADAFDVAWLLHQKRNPHHWQFWVLPEDDRGEKVLRMPDHYCREMFADWRGAGLAQGNPDTAGWYHANKHRMKLHPDTRAWVEEAIREVVALGLTSAPVKG